MKYNPTLLAFAVLLAVVYGVLFSISYPLVEISGGIVGLCVLFGIVTCLAIPTILDTLTRSKMSPTHTNFPPPPTRTHPPPRPSPRPARRHWPCSPSLSPG